MPFLAENIHTRAFPTLEEVPSGITQVVDSQSGELWKRRVMLDGADRWYRSSRAPAEFNVAMARLGIGRRELAEETGISADTISRYKSGAQPVPKLLQRYLELRLRLIEAERKRTLSGETEA